MLLLMKYQCLCPLFLCDFPYFCLSSCNFSSCDIIHDVLSLNSSFSSCSFFMSTLIFYSTFTMFFFQISTLCLLPFWKSLSLSNSSYITTFSFSPMVNLLFKLLTSKFKYPIFKLTIVMVWNNSTALLFALLLRLPPPQTLVYLSMSWDFWILLQMIPSPTLICSLTQIQLEIPMQILVY
jgi:hypothetical protein